MTERKIEYASQHVVTDAGRNCLIRYAITVDEIEIIESLIECYGVEVHLVSADKEECKTIRCITTKVESIERILRLLSDGLVFPEDLEETLENILE